MGDAMSKTLIDYAWTFLGVPYIWGGQSRDGCDCSGFVQMVLAAAGIDPVGDQTAQALYNAFLNEKARGTGFDRVTLLFFGRSKEAITHVAIQTSPNTMIEAGGGGHECTTVAEARQRGAEVRLRPISSRSDLVAALTVRYSPLVL